MSNKILIVDDDPNILQAFRRGLRKLYDVETAENPGLGITALSSSGPFAVVIADMNMPQMDGIHFLAKAREIAPETVRMMLTGNTAQQTAIDAVNEGCIFRFMNKPCPPEKLVAFIEAGIEQYRLITAEREILAKTLNGSIKLFTDLMAMVNPTAFGRSSRVRRLAKMIAERLHLADTWKVEIAAMLSQIGCITLPEETLTKIYHGASAHAQGVKIFEEHPKIGSDLVANIPRLEDIAEIIAFQEKRWYGGGPPAVERKGEAIPLASRILKVALDYDTLASSGFAVDEILTRMGANKDWYDATVFAALKDVIDLETRKEIMAIHANELVSGMILVQDIRTSQGVLLVAKGQEVTPSLSVRVKNFIAMGNKIESPILVICPADPTP